MAEEKQSPPDRLSPRQEAYLKTSKEVAIKFIETGRLTMATFPETFRQIYMGVKEAVEAAVEEDR